MLACVLACLCALPSFSLDKPYTASADYIMFDIDKKILHCEGQAELIFGMLRVQAKNIKVDTKTHILHAEGTVTLSTMLRSPTPAVAGTEKAVCGTKEVKVPGAILSDGETMAEEADRKLKEIDACEKSGNIQNYEGDVLLFDLQKMAGVLIKTKSEVRKIYLQGEELYEVSEMPQIGEPKYLYEEPDIMANAITAKRVRISPDDAYEAWNSVLWFKGNRLTQLPYWTNTSNKLTRGNIKLKKIKYSSNNDWGLGTRYRYSDAKGKKGFVDLNYYGDGGHSYVANLSQQFKFKNNLSGSLGMGTLFGSRRSYSISMMRHGGSVRNQNMNLSISRKGRQSFRLGTTAKMGSTQIQGYFRAFKNKHVVSYNGLGQSSMDAMVRFMGKTRPVLRNDKYKYRMSSSLGWQNNRANDSAGSMFVGLSMFRSAIKITKKLRISTSLNGGVGGYTEGSIHNNYGSSVRLNQNLGHGKSFGLSYRYNQNRDIGETSSSQSLSSTYSMARGRTFNVRLSSSYNLRRNRFGSLSTAFNYELNKKASLQSNLIYNLERGVFSVKNYNLRYDFYGSMLTTYWNVENNDLIIDFSSKF